LLPDLSPRQGSTEKLEPVGQKDLRALHISHAICGSETIETFFGLARHTPDTSAP